MSAKRAVVVIVLLALAGLAWQFSRSDGGGKKPPRSNAIAVTLAKAETRDVPIVIALTGRTEPFESVSLKSRVDGQVKSVNFREGQPVRKGDLLVQLDPADFQARLRQAEASLSRSQALAAKAKADLERSTALRHRGFISEEKLAEGRTALAAAEATANADAATEELVRLQLSYTSIRAPFEGVVGNRLVYPGSAVKVNETSLALVNRVRPLMVAFAAPEKYLPRLRAALRSPSGSLPARITLPGSDTAWDASVRIVDNGVDVATGTVQLKATLPNEGEPLAAGQFVEVRLVLETLRDALVIPAEALQQGADGSFVFVARSDDSVEVRKVSLIEVQDKWAIIAKGLVAGEQVVIEGQLRLTAGAKIRRSATADGKPDQPGPGLNGPPGSAPPGTSPGKTGTAG